MDFTLFNGNTELSLIPLTKGSSTVILPGKLVALDRSKLAIEADAADTAVAFTPIGAISGDTVVFVIKNKEAILVGTAGGPYYAATDKGLTCDIAISGSDQLIDLTNSKTNVLQVHVRDDAGVDGAVTPLQVFINKPLVNNM